jgi:hypothetical protein
MWRFDTKTNIWTWIAGTGSLDVPWEPGYPRYPSPTISPGSRARFAYASEITVDHELRMWIYGGEYQLNTGFYADLWYFSNITLTWTRWHSCPPNAERAAPCDTLGPMPGARRGSSMWIDSPHQTIYIAFGNVFLEGSTPAGTLQNTSSWLHSFFPDT